ELDELVVVEVEDVLLVEVDDEVVEEVEDVVLDVVEELDDVEVVEDVDMVDEVEVVDDVEVVEDVDVVEDVEVVEDVDVVDDVDVVEVVDVVVVVGGTLIPLMSTGAQLHFDPVPGFVSISFMQAPSGMLSQLVQVPASATPSALESVHVIMVENVKVLKRQVPPPAEQGPVTAFVHGVVFWA